MRRHHIEDNSGWGSRFRKSSVKRRIPKDSSVRGSGLRWEFTFSIDVKEGDIHHIHGTNLYAWRESTKVCFQGEQWS
jgi:hypothetical protein